MKSFRVWPDGRVDNRLPFQVFDNVGYVPVGGTDMSYVQLDSDLVADARRDGGVVDADVEHLTGTKIRLVRPASQEAPTNEPGRSQPRQALVLLPSKLAFQFNLNGSSREPQPAARYANDRTALLVVLEEGDVLTAIPRARSLSELETSATIVISFDGEKVVAEVRNRVALAA